VALLQIAEPGLSTAPHQHRRAIGIDLGTTHSLVASVLSGTPTVLPDAAGEALLPSVVRYLERGASAGAGELVVGLPARAAQDGDPLNTIASVKRLMGRRLTDLSAAESAAYQLADTPGMVSIETAAGRKSPVQVSADILKVLRDRAEAALGGEVSGAVITVPAYFDDAQRQATKDAAQMAGLNVLRLLNEPTAAAIAYGLDRGSEGIFAVYDLGGGTFDISILRFSRGIFEVLATGGDSTLGGDDFDRAIVGWLAERCADDAQAPRDRRLLLTQARAAKERLSLADSTRVECTLCSGCRVDRRIARADFEALAAPLVDRTLGPVRAALRDAGVAAASLDGVILVGGSTRMPIVRRAVAEFFGQTPRTDLDPDQVVALGAAMQADVLAGNRAGDPWLLLDVCPLSLGLETMGGLVERIIPRNSVLPTARAQEFTTFKDGQIAMQLHVVQGERELAAESRSLAQFTLRSIPPMPAGAARVRVTFQIDADGLLSVSAVEQSSGAQAQVEVRPTYGLGDQEVARMLADGIGKSQSDAQARMLREAQVDARRLLDATEAALAADGHELLSPPERAEIASALGDLVEALNDPVDAATLRLFSDRLNGATTEFAARRMNAGIQRALAGVSVDAI